MAAKTTKRRNSERGFTAKVDIRRHVLDDVGGAVFDAFAGDGEMYRAIWREAESYLGCDLEWYRDERLVYAADNRRVMRAIDLSGFRVFDLDAFGAPWEQAVILAARRPVPAGERVGVILTEGSGLKMKQGTLPKSLATIAGLHGHVAGGSRLRDEVVDRAVLGLAERMNCDIERRWQARGKVGSAMLYIGLVLVGRGGDSGNPGGKEEAAESQAASSS